MKEIKTRTLEIVQPIGTFFLGKVKASELEGCVKTTQRHKSIDGIQRELSLPRLKEISSYCSDPDATFPTAIIIGVDSSQKGVDCTIGKDGEMAIRFEDTFGEIIDGQHRLNGIWESGMADKFDLPVVFMLNPTTEEKAYVFSIINSKQTKVNPSLIYDLFDVSLSRSPQKTAHELARALNGKVQSPFYNRLKMLGKATKEQTDATLSQGTFSKRIVSLISKYPEKDAIAIKKGEQPPLNEDEKFIFRKYFLEDRDDIILKILLNCFNALKEEFYELWEKPHENILWKTTGFNAIIDALPKMYHYCLNAKSLEQKTFRIIFKRFREILNKEELKLTSDFFGSGEKETRNLKDIITQAVQEVYQT